MTALTLHLVSDSTGGTISAVADAALAQFRGQDVDTRHWPLVRNDRQMDAVIAALTADAESHRRAAVLFTLVDDRLAERLVSAARAAAIPVLPILQPAIALLSDALGMRATAEPGLQHKMDAAYFARMDAMDFALRHDDGQGVQDAASLRAIAGADVVLVGVSRTSKTPTSIYLANRGVKVANIPLVPHVHLDDAVFTAQGPLYVGLTIAPARLCDIRRNRVTHLGVAGGGYDDLAHVEDELQNARRLFARHGWPVIDVTRRSVEETAAEILQVLDTRTRARSQQRDETSDDAATTGKTG